jgi:hypothetical protein
MDSAFWFSPKDTTTAYFRNWAINALGGNGSILDDLGSDFAAIGSLCIDPRAGGSGSVDYSSQPHQYLFAKTNQAQVMGLSGVGAPASLPSVNGLAFVSRTGWGNYGGSHTTDSLLLHRVAGFAGDYDNLGAETKVYKMGMLIGVDSYVDAGVSANGDLSVVGSAVRFGDPDSPWNEFKYDQYAAPDAPGGTALLRWSSANHGSWPQAYGDQSSTYAHMCADSAGSYRADSTYNWHVASAMRCLTDFKRDGWDQFVVEQDEVFLDVGHSEPIQRAIHYPQNGMTSPSPDQPYPTGTTICVDSSGAQVACSLLSSSVRIMSTEDGMGTPKRQYGVISQIYSPGSVTLKWDCPGSGYAPQCTPTGTYGGGYGYSDRVTIAGGSSIGANVEKLEDVVVHKIMNGLSDTSFFTAALNPSALWTGVQACGSRSCVAYLASRGADTLTSVPVFVTSAGGNLPFQYLISGISPGVYTVTIQGAAVSGSPFTVSGNDNSIEFEGGAGTVYIYQSQSVPISAVVDSSYSSTGEPGDGVNWMLGPPSVASNSIGGLGPGTSGSGQSSTVGEPYGSRLGALVKDGGGNTVASVSKTSSADSTGAGVALSDEKRVSKHSNATYTSVPGFVTSTSGSQPFQYLISGIAPGVYTVTVGGPPVSGSPFTVYANDNSIEFTGGAGLVSINQSVPVEAVLSSIVVSAQNSLLAYGNTEQFSAVGTYSDGSTGDLSSKVTWTSSAPGVATVSTTGLVSALATGLTYITANLGGTISNRFQLTVVPGRHAPPQPQRPPRPTRVGHL